MGPDAAVHKWAYFLLVVQDTPRGSIPLACGETTIYLRQVSKAVNISMCMSADMLMWRPCRLELVAMNVYIGLQLEKSRTGVSINSMAGQSSGWALPCILVFFHFLCYLHSTK